MRRRSLLGICACAISTTAIKAAAWPVGKCGDRKQAPSYASGCMLMGAAAAEQLRAISYFYTLPDRFVANGFLATQVVMDKIYSVKPAFYYFEDGSAPNAYALPIAVDGDCEADGSIIFGTSLLADEMSSNPTMWGSALSVIVAHEYGHIVQYKRNVQLQPYRKELHADYLSGWAVGKMNIAQVGGGVDPRVAAATLYSKGSYDFNDATFHGTPEQRQAAMKAGYRQAYEGAPLDYALARGMQFVSNF